MTIDANTAFSTAIEHKYKDAINYIDNQIIDRSSNGHFQVTFDPNVDTDTHVTEWFSDECVVELIQHYYEKKGFKTVYFYGCLASKNENHRNFLVISW